jgi:hypothetical protein
VLGRRMKILLTNNYKNKAELRTPFSFEKKNDRVTEDAVNKQY